MSTNFIRMDPVRGEMLQRVYEIYRSRAAEFQKMFNGLTVFGLVFLFMILSHVVDFGQQASLADQEWIKETYREIGLALEQVRENIDSQLRSEVDGLLLRLSSQMASSETRDEEVKNDCDAQFGADETIWRNCRVHQQIDKRLSAYRRDLTQLIQTQFESLQQQMPSLFGNQEYHNAVNQIVGDMFGAFEDAQTSTPNFWQSSQEQNEFFNYLIEAAADAEQHLQRSRDEALDTYNRQSRLDRIAQNNVDISIALASTPIRLHVLLLAFPALFAIGFLICAYQLCELIRIRQRWHKLYRSFDQKEEIWTDEEITLVAPLWLDPANSLTKTMTQLAVLLLPFTIFIVICGLVFYDWSQSPKYPQDAPWRLWQGGLDLCGLGIFVYGFWQIRTELSRYASEFRHHRVTTQTF